MKRWLVLLLAALIAICSACYGAWNVYLYAPLFSESNPQKDQGECAFVLTPTPPPNSPFSGVQPVALRLENDRSLEPIQPSNAKQITELERIGHGKIKAVHWTPGLKLLVLSSVGMWSYDPTAMETPPRLLWKTDKQFGAVFSPDGTLLAVGTEEEPMSIALWKADTGEPLMTLQPKDYHPGDYINPFRDGLHNMTFSPDGSLLAALEKGTIYLWNVKTGAYLKNLPGFTNWTYSLAFRADSKVLAAGGVDESSGDAAQQSRSIRVWDIASGQEIATIEGKDLGIEGVSLSPDGTTLVSRDGTYSGDHLRLWDLATGVQQRVIATPFMNTQLDFSPDGRQLIYGTRLFDTNSGAEIAVFGDGDTLIPGPDHTFLTVFDDGFALWRDEKPPNRLKNLQDFNHPDDINFVTANTNGELVSYTKRIPIGSWPAQGGPYISYWLIGNRAALVTLEGSDGPEWVRLCDTTTGKQVSAVLGNEPVFSPDGKILATSNLCGVNLIDSMMGTDLKYLGSSNCGITVKIFSPDQDIVAFASGSSRTAYCLIEIWDTQTGKQLAVLKGHTAEITSMAFSADKRLLISASADGTIRFWGVPSP